MFEEVESDIEDGCAQTYMLTRIWTVEDACGNTNSHTQTVEVVDTTSPLFVNVGGLMNEEVVSVPYDDVYGNVTLWPSSTHLRLTTVQRLSHVTLPPPPKPTPCWRTCSGMEDTIAYLSNVESTGLQQSVLDRR